MSPLLDDVCGAGARVALGEDLAHPLFGSCHIREFPDAFFPQAPRGSAVLGLEWAGGGSASVATSPELWFFQWLDAGQKRGRGLIAHLALVLEDWGVVEARCLALDKQADSVLRLCGFRPWIDGPPTERHLLQVSVADGAAYARRREGSGDCAAGGKCDPDLRPQEALTPLSVGSGPTHMAQPSRARASLA